MTSAQSPPKPTPAPSGDGCKECLETGGWWVHLRRCVECGHIGCCNSSPSQHGKKHWEATRHKILTSYEPGETWFYDWSTDEMIADLGVGLTPPLHHPLNQPAPGPEGKVPPNWQELLNY
jgi:hypothetical protein